jgi:hypothetical protein
MGLFDDFQHRYVNDVFAIVTSWNTGYADPSLVRITGGILLVLQAQDPLNVALIIVNMVFQGTGLIPLLLSMMGLVFLMLVSRCP